MIRWGIIGAGNIAHRFAESLKHVEEGELIAISCRKMEKARAFAREYPCSYLYDDGGYGLLENPDVDAVYISLPHGLHCEWAIRAMKAGKAVLCEKPAVLTTEEMDQISQTSRETGILFMEAMKTRFVPIHRLIIEIYEKGVVGQISRIETSLCNKSEQRAPDKYLYDPVQGGILLDCGIYCASWIDELTSGIYGSPEVRNADFRMEGEVESYAKSWLRYKNLSGDQELRVMLECAFDEKKPRMLTIRGDQGTIEVPELHRPETMEMTLSLTEKTREEEAWLDDLAATWKGQISWNENKQEKRYVFTLPYEVDDFYGQIRHFCHCLQEGRQESPVMSLEASRACIEIIEMIRERKPDISFHGISIQYNNRIVRINTDRNLLDFLDQKGNGSLELADHIHCFYQDKWGKPLEISRESLAVEILIHVYCDLVFDRIDRIVEKIGKPGRLQKDKLAFLKRATEVIDCGERAVDSNRIVFDQLAPFRQLLFLILGDKA